MSIKKTFTARIKSLESGLGWRIVDVPFDVKKVFGKGGRVPVRGTVNGFAFRTSLFSRKDGPHFLMLNKQMQKGAHARELGDAVEVVIEHDTAERTVKTPKLLLTVLAEDPEIKDYFEGLSYSMRRFMSEHITQAKSQEVQRRRAEEIAMILTEMKEGEESPPPILAKEFARNPKARRGWEKLPPSHKRGHLWGIYYYKPGEARERRTAKAIAMMEEYADK